MVHFSNEREQQLNEQLGEIKIEHFILGDSMSKQGEKRSTSKNYIFMKKYERI